jgi:multicomponent Na+:H+ antiporter subunit D
MEPAAGPLPMIPDDLLPAAIVLTSLVPGLLIFALDEESHVLRTTFNLAGAVAKLALVGWLILGVYEGRTFESRLTLAPGLDLVLNADALSVLFVTLSTVLWLVTTVYAIGYLEHSPHRSRFFGFFSLCVSATVGLALAGNLLTFVMFYEALTLATYPLVAHRGTPDAIQGARVYLIYTLSGGALLLTGAAWLHALAGPVVFTQGGMLAGLGGQHDLQLMVIFFLLLAGLGVKAALVPLHGWLPQAMVAPAPVSALLHAVAVVKAGAFGILRVVYDVYGVTLAESLGLLSVLAVLASVTILYGSIRALSQDGLKKRLAYSTVSQVSYIALGASIVGPIATIGGVVHLVHQGIMKITLFFCAGNYAETLGVHRVSEMDGVGRRMPWTTLAFTVGALGMIGVPPVAGFVSKWYLGLGAADAGSNWVLLVLVTSSLLNAGYFFPILFRAWFKEPPASWPAEHIPAGRLETAAPLLWPPVVTALLALAAGLFAAAPVSPLEWAELIARREYGL